MGLIQNHGFVVYEFIFQGVFADKENVLFLFTLIAKWDFNIYFLLCARQVFKGFLINAPISRWRWQLIQIGWL